MKWRKLGHLFSASGKNPIMATHAANPIAEHIEGDWFRIYYNSRDASNRSSIGYAVVEIGNQIKKPEVAEVPLLLPGDLGLFDEDGLSLGCIVRKGDKRYIYYVGWNLSISVPWRNSIGLAVSSINDLKFERYSRAPILDRNEIDPYSLSYPFVLPDTDHFKMWYGSNLRWGKAADDMIHVIKCARSDDGIHWERSGHIAINLRYPDEWGISRPFILKEQKIYKMWYCYRGKTYRMGYAESEDGTNFERKDEDVGIEPSPSGWDSEAVCYPYIFDHKGCRYMLYNGNRYGLTGIGLAILDKE